jgi:hypothetical protein
LGFQKLSNILPSNPNLKSDIAKQPAIGVETQLELSRLLKVAYTAPKIESLVDEILQATTSLVPELCSAVVKILHNHGRSSEALALLEEHFTNSVNGRCPQLSRQKGLILQSLGLKTRDAAQAFEFAIAQFSEQLGPLNDATLSTRREYALFRAMIGDRKALKLSELRILPFWPRITNTSHQARRENFLLIETLVLIFVHQSGCIVIQIANN